MRFFTLPQLAELLDLCEEATRRLVQSDSGPRYYRLGKRYRFAESDVKDWLETLKAKASAQRTAA